MPKAKLIVVVIGVFLLGSLAGGGAVYAFRQKTQQPSESTANIASESVDDSLLGDDALSPAQMHEKLQSMPADRTFDMHYTKYLIMLRNNESAMALLAKEKSQRPELKQQADQLIDEDKQLIEQLYGWQNAWGFSDH